MAGVTYIEGWAFKPNERERYEQSAARAQTLRDKGVRLTIMDRANAYGRTTYRGLAPSHLTPQDIAALCDANHCFGGMVERAAGAFVCSIYTD